MLKLGLTGNIGCGKSSVSEELKKRGAHIIDADLIAREIYYFEDVIEEMKIYFPDAVRFNCVDRKILGEIVFSDEKKLERLNQITHKKIRKIIENKISDYIDTDELVVVDAALLFEANFEDMVDKVVVVYCREREQLKRIILRDNLTKDEAIKRMQSQMSQSEKIRLADYTIDNSGSLAELKTNVVKLVKETRKWKV